MSPVLTLGRHMLPVQRANPASTEPLVWLSIVGAALCEIAEMRRELDSINSPAAASLACALNVLRRDALRILNSLAREVRGQ